ncbi:integrase [Streptomyces sp. ITFR-6]|uniref:integrase n=1 Tax=Streptomyces sp. ITFR-6 TaxID=3075197 RepID=UPI0037DA43F0
MEGTIALVVTEELLGHAHIGVTAGVHLRLQRQANDALGSIREMADQPPTVAVLR